MRLPPRGPRTFISNPTLVLVTQDHHVHITYLRQYTSSFATLKRLLTSPGITKEQFQATDVTENPRNNRQCIQAAIGLGYDGKISINGSVHKLKPISHRDIHRYSHIFTSFTSTAEDNSTGSDTI
jgi:hypothetical protein